MSASLKWMSRGHNRSIPSTCLAVAAGSSSGGTSWESATPSHPGGPVLDVQLRGSSCAVGLGADGRCTSFKFVPVPAPATSCSQKRGSAWPLPLPDSESTGTSKLLYGGDASRTPFVLLRQISPAAYCSVLRRLVGGITSSISLRAVSACWVGHLIRVMAASERFPGKRLVSNF